MRVFWTSFLLIGSITCAPQGGSDSTWMYLTSNQDPARPTPEKPRGQASGSGTYWSPGSHYSIGTNIAGAASPSGSGPASYSANTAGGSGPASYSASTARGSGPASYSANTAGGSGPASYSTNTARVSGPAAYSTNTAGGSGPASYSTNTAEGSGPASYSTNTARVSGPASYSTNTARVSRPASYSTNTAGGSGPASYRTNAAGGAGSSGYGQHGGQKRQSGVPGSQQQVAEESWTSSDGEEPVITPVSDEDQVYAYKSRSRYNKNRFLFSQSRYTQTEPRHPWQPVFPYPGKTSQQSKGGF